MADGNAEAPRPAADRWVYCILLFCGDTGTHAWEDLVSQNAHVILEQEYTLAD